MIDFWVAVLLTAIVSVLTVLGDWAASRIVVGAKVIRTLSQILRAGMSAQETIGRIRQEVERYKASRSGALAWGADLATVAISMDFVALGIWIHSPQMFPFFARFNSGGASREIPVWLIVIGLHVVLVIASLALKHNHAEIVAARDRIEIPPFPNRIWFAHNGWMFAANSTGTISLLAAIVVFTNAV